MKSPVKENRTQAPETALRPDRRRGRTRALLKRLLLEELRREELGQISVTSLCRKADINRSTFYQHYADIYALLEDIEQDFLAATDRLAGRIIQTSLPPEAVCEQIFAYIRENRELLSLLLFRSENEAFLNRLNEKILHLFREKVLQAYSLPEGLAEAGLADTLLFLSAGFYSIYMRWLSGGCQEDLSALTARSIRLSEACLGSLLWKKP